MYKSIEIYVHPLACTDTSHVPYRTQSTQRHRKPPPPRSRHRNQAVNTPSQSASFLGHPDDEHSPTPTPPPPSYSLSSSIASPHASVHPSPPSNLHTSSHANHVVESKPNVKPSSFQNKTKPIYKVKPKPQTTRNGPSKPSGGKSKPAPPPLTNHVLDKYKQSKHNTKQSQSFTQLHGQQKPAFFQTHTKSPTLTLSASNSNELPPPTVRSTAGSKSVKELSGLYAAKQKSSMPPRPSSAKHSNSKKRKNNNHGNHPNHNNHTKFRNGTGKRKSSGLVQSELLLDDIKEESDGEKHHKTANTSHNSTNSKSTYKWKPSMHDEKVTDINIASSTFSPDDSKNEFNLVQSRTSPPHTDHDDELEYINNQRNKPRHINLRKPSDSRSMQNVSKGGVSPTLSSKGGASPTLTATTHRGRENSVSYSTNSMWSEAQTVDANVFNSLLVMQDIETYKVIFDTRVCGIELVPFDEMHSLGAVVIKCHTEFSKQQVVVESLLVAIGNTLCIDTDYDEILAIISTSERPLKLTFHPPTMNKMDMIEEVSGYSHHQNMHEMRPSMVMKLNDDFGDAEPEWDENNESFVPPDKLFNAGYGNDEFAQMVHKNYRMLYHKYRELAQFQDLTKGLLATKMDEIKRLSKENTNLKAMLNSKESELHQSQRNQSSEQQRGKKILDEYQKLNEKNVEMERKNMEQQQHIDRLQFDLKQCQIKIRELTRVQSELHKQQQKEQPKQPQNGKKSKKGMNGYNHTKHVQKHKSSDDRLQNELRNRLRQYSKQGAAPQLHRSPQAISTLTLPTPAQKRKHHLTHHPRSKSTHDTKANDKVMKKRESAIGLLFKNFTSKRKDTNSSTLAEAATSPKYHPQVANMMASSGGTRKKSQAQKANKPSRARSSSLESNTGRARKETIV